jgi:hypothetical protein
LSKASDYLSTIRTSGIEDGSRNGERMVGMVGPEAREQEDIMKRLIWIILAVATSSLSSLLFCIVSEAVAAIPKDNLVLYLPMDEGKGSEARDESGNGNDGVLLGDPKWVEGKSGSAIEFDGTDDCIEVANSDSLNPKEITIALWVKLGEVPAPGYNGIVSKWAPNWSGYLLQAHASHPIEPLVGDGTAQFAAIRGLKGAEQDVWYHAAMTWDGKTLSLYINGKEPDYDKAASDHGMAGEMKVPISSLLIGKRHDQHFFKGVIDEVMIFNKALSLDDIQFIMEHGLAVKNYSGKVSTTWAALKKQD